MRIAFLTCRNLLHNDGAAKKIKAQVETWIQLGHEVKVFCIVFDSTESIPKHDGFPIVFYNPQNYTQKLFGPPFLWKDLNAFSPVLIYLRFDLHRPFLHRISVRYHTCLELNTDDISEMRLSYKRSFRSRCRYYYHILTRNYMFNNAAGLVSPTYEISRLPSIAKYQKPTLVLPNGILLEEYLHIERNTRNSASLPVLGFIGSPHQPWHGIDKIITLAQHTIGKLIFHMIGVEQKNFQPLPNVCYHGFMERTEYEKILLQCDVGISSLALHRKKMEEACSLKTREYLAYGLPIIIGYEDTAFMNTPMPEWILQLPNTEQNVCNAVEQIIWFSQKMKGFKVPIDAVKPLIDCSSLEKKRVAFFEKLLSGQI